MLVVRCKGCILYFFIWRYECCELVRIVTIFLAIVKPLSICLGRLHGIQQDESPVWWVQEGMELEREGEGESEVVAGPDLHGIPNQAQNLNFEP